MVFQGHLFKQLPRLSAVLSSCRSFSSNTSQGILVVAEHSNGAVSKATLSCVTAAQQLGSPITLLFSGTSTNVAAKSAGALEGVTKILTAEHALLSNHLPEPLSGLVSEIQRRRNYTHIVAPATTFGKNFLPRAAALLDVQPTADVIKILDADTFLRPIYAGNALATVKCSQPGLRMLTVRGTSFAPAAATSSAAPPVIEPVSNEELEAVVPAGSEFVGLEGKASERPDLGTARVVVCGGRALKGAEGFQMLETLADLLGGAVGASRAAVDAGWVQSDLQVGQTGKVVAPELYIAVGISGAIQHLAGMKDSRVIVAINNNAEEPIFQVADYGLVADCFQAVPELIQEVKNIKA